MFSNFAQLINSNKYKKWTLLSFWMLILSLSWLVEAKAEEKPVGQILGVIGEIQYRTATDTPDTPVAIKEKTGDAKLVSFSPWKKVVFKQPVYAKDEFKTSKRSRLKIKFNDNSLMALGPNSKMQVGSYIYNKEKKLRQGVMKVSYGLSMYIVNKSQRNKRSSFRIVSPTANLAARGTQGYVSSSDKMTYLANQAGAMDSSSSDPNIAGNELVGAMKKNSIPKGKPPTPPTNLSNNELNSVRGVVMGPSGINPNNPLIKDQTQTAPAKKKKSKESKKDDSGGKKSDKEGDSDSEEGDSESSDSSEGGDDSGGDSESSDSSEGGDSGDSGSDSSSSDSGGGDSGGGDSGGGGGFAESFTATGSSAGGAGGGGGDFAPVNNPFSPAALSSCSG